MTTRGKVFLTCVATAALIAAAVHTAVSSTETVMSVQTTDTSDDATVDKEETTERSTMENEWMTFTATAYCSCETCCGAYSFGRPKDVYGKELVYTASGSLAVQGRTVAADWNILPCGTVIEIEGYGVYEVQDKGGAIVGNAIDVYFDDHQDALEFGVRPVNVKIISDGGECT